jgi:hypothetical protein
VGRKITFADGNDDFLSSNLHSTAYGRLTLRFTFGTQP